MSGSDAHALNGMEVCSVEVLERIDALAGNGVVTAALRAAIINHRNTFVTEADMITLALNGVNAIRIPVGYWLLATAQVRARQLLLSAEVHAAADSA
jgi:hypothetical protein